ncbi:MAG: pyruvate kinase alpha/beta domain-containing protein [Anaerolineae bacterium]
MSMVRKDVAYFTNPGPNNTERTLKVAKERADQLGLRTVVVASTTGDTGLAAAKLFEGSRVVVVTHSTGYQQPNVQEVSPERMAEMRQHGALVLTCQHAFGGVGRAVRIKLGTYELDEIVAYTLRLFGQGMKVAFEVTLMATDAGLIHAGDDTLVIGGTGRGADTAVILRAANSMRFFDLVVQEIVCMPGGLQPQS